MVSSGLILYLDLVVIGRGNGVVNGVWVGVLWRVVAKVVKNGVVASSQTQTTPTLTYLRTFLGASHLV